MESCSRVVGSVSVGVVYSNNYALLLVIMVITVITL